MKVYFHKGVDKMSTDYRLWYRDGDVVTHYCGGSEDKKKQNKPKGTQTQATFWFNPTTVLAEGEVRCNACSIVMPEDAPCVDMGE
jgi:hypothetical protein